MDDEFLYGVLDKAAFGASHDIDHSVYELWHPKPNKNISEGRESGSSEESTGCNTRVEKAVILVYFGFPSTCKPSGAKGISGFMIRYSVCRSWREEAKSFDLETVDLRKDIRKLAELREHPHRIRYIRRIIGDPYRSFNHFVVPPMRVRALEFRADLLVDTPIPAKRTIEIIFAFQDIIEVFTFRDSIPMMYSSFRAILKSLGQCKQLRKLSLPPADRSGYSRQKHADDAYDAFRQMALDLPNIEDRPQLQFLQLVSASERDSPEVASTACTKGPQKSEYKWLEEPNCPFNLHALRVLVVGCPSAAQIVLPIVSHSLCKLELCQAFDPRSSWTQYEHFLASPIQLSSLKHLVLTFHIRPSKWLLDMIRAPVIETISFKWTTNTPHASYEEYFRRIDGQISRLDPTPLCGLAGNGT
ncbi:hypothetical protein C8J55DRAFT_488184 [Lentinula edodes]|uniref:Uncharacterized protein n=1 Tax=Lentinula lateritia TaxID=40482 RepID=A0A9W9AJG9_9AGAR|nr:hypothetical protein C8J55DRAFT_488184 [Lentinula edodes]